MGFVTAYSACVGCRRLFTYNPMRVPSIRIKGTREPVCASCLDRINVRRAMFGLDPIVALPGAYEACDESDVVYGVDD